MSRISQKLGHSRHSGDIHTGGGGYETSARERHIQRQSRPPKRPIRRYLFPWICFPENTQATSKQLFGSGLAARRALRNRRTARLDEGGRRILWPTA